MGGKRLDARIEYDSFGPIQIPANSYWGAQTARARDELFTCGWKFHPKLVESIVLVKKAAALVNGELGRLDSRLAEAIVQACDEVLSGQLRDQFIAEPFQSGSGLALNINVNEVLANRAEEILGGTAGEYKLVDPHRHLNLSQSSNDVFITAMRLAVITSLKEFEPALLDLERLLRRKALEFAKIVKVGRSHLRDSVPITLGQEFNAFGSTVERSYKNLKEASNSLFELNIGGTQIGTGWDAHPSYQTRMVEKVTSLTKFRLKAGEDLLRMSQSMSDFVQVSSALRQLAIELGKIANDLRLLNSGPQGGLAEIKMPPVLFSPSPLLSEALPEEVQPLLAESLNMVCFQIIGMDLSIAFAAQAGQLETNPMAAGILHNLLQALDLLRQSILAFNQKCLAGISADNERCQHLLTLSGALLAAVSEQIGLNDARALFKMHDDNPERLRQALLEGNILSPPVIEKIFNHTYFTTASIRPKVDEAMESAS
jgi:aspartate ammonia-lyase